ncbi:D(1C) dopamine receptor [Callorhinchus milii]|uniref:D(1C) dopamine receptor n=1 Tax=Callorhinchus milii TaxID=7868 RepID=UPI001C3FB14C|nr:D(1C) dopamine receptor [Callorhinchus milii]
MPWKAVTEVAGRWLFGSFCDTWIAFDIMCSTASILNLCIISLDRYWAIASPFRYERKMTQRVAFVMIGVAWTLSILISFIPVQLNWHKTEADLLRELEGEDRNATRSCDSNLSRTYAISSSLISFYIPVAIMVGTYTRIYRIAQTQIRRISSLERAVEHAQNCQDQPADCPHEAALKTSFKKETKVLKTLSIIMGVFVFCWLPFFVVNCLVPFCEPGLDQDGELPCVSETTFNIFVWFGWANSSLNPVIYAFNADFRKAFATILGCARFCPSNSVEAVNFSNELVSYHHDTTLQKDANAASLPNQLPHPAGEPRVPEPPFGKASGISSPPTPRDGRNLLLPAGAQFECDAEITLDTITPITPAGPIDAGAVHGRTQHLQSPTLFEHRALEGHGCNTATYGADTLSDWGPSPAEDWGPSPAEDWGPSPAEDWGPSPAEDWGPSPAEDWGPSPAEDWGPSPAEDWGPSPAEDWGPSPAEDWGPSPAEDWGPSPAEDWGPSPAEDWGPSPAEDWGPAPAEDGERRERLTLGYAASDLKSTPGATSHCLRKVVETFF